MIPSAQSVERDLDQSKTPPIAAFLSSLWRQRYVGLTGLVLLLALALTLLIPQDQRRLHMPEPWSYALAAQNFAQGKWTLTNDELAAARTEVRLQGSRLTQYVEIEPGRWAFRQSPGHPLQMAPFTTIGWPRLANVTLAVLATLVLYPVLAAWRDERLAFLGATLLLWTPISLLALHYTNMDNLRRRHLAACCRGAASGLRAVGQGDGYP